MSNNDLTEVEITRLDEALTRTINNTETDFVLWSAYSHLPMDEMLDTALKQALAEVNVPVVKYPDAEDTYFGGRLDVTALLTIKIGERVLFIVRSRKDRTPLIVSDPTQLQAAIWSDDQA